MAISISYYGSKRPAPNVKPQRTINYPDGTPPEKLPFGKKNPIDWMTGKHLVQLKPEENAQSVSDGRVKVTSDDDLAYLEEKIDEDGSLVAAENKLKLAGDAAAPGASKVYGTDGAGAKGWHDAPSSLPSGTVNGQVLVWDSATSAWVPGSVDTLPGGTVTGQIMIWNQTTGEWDVLAFPIPSGTTGQILQHDGTGWAAVNGRMVPADGTQYKVLQMTGASTYGWDWVRAH